MAPDSDLYAQALAEVQAIRPADAATAPAAPRGPKPVPPGACCAGDRTGYQKHQRHGETPCEASRKANNAYMREYCRARRKAAT